MVNKNSFIDMVLTKAPCQDSVLMKTRVPPRASTYPTCEGSRSFFGYPNPDPATLNLYNHLIEVQVFYA